MSTSGSVSLGVLAIGTDSKDSSRHTDADEARLLERNRSIVRKADRRKSKRCKRSKIVRRNRTAAKRRAKVSVLRDIRRLQNSTRLIMPRAPFSRAVREVMSKVSGSEMRIQHAAVELLQVGLSGGEKARVFSTSVGICRRLKSFS